MITIIGAGLSGMSAAYHLKGSYTLLEKENSAGGLCRSMVADGHTIDMGGGHVIFTNDSYAKSLFENLLGKNLLWHGRKSYIFLQNTYVKYPFEANLYGLSQKTIDECISGVEKRKGSGAKNFDEWIVQTFGDGIAKHYMRPYNRKIWQHDLRKMSIGWIADRVPAPDADDIKKGAKKPADKEFGPNASFGYPSSGGIQSLSDALSMNLKISFESEVKQIKTGSLTVIYEKKSSKKSLKAEKILSSLPLPELVKIIDDVPSSVEKAAERLVYNSMVCLAVSIDRPNVSDMHWIYYPEKDTIFNRVIVLSNFSPNMSPKNESTLLIENTYKNSKKIDIEERKERILDDLKKTDIVKNGDNIKILNASNVKYAYIVYDINHDKNVSIIHEFLNEIGIVPIGRFGKWEYFNMDKSMLDGKHAAETR